MRSSFVLVLAAMALVGAPGDELRQPMAPASQKVIALDPGHGGVDLGVRSGKSVLEKSVALKLANMIQTKVKSYPGLSVFLTREGDLDRSQLSRIEIANARKADLFLSLHTGGGFTPMSRPIEIFVADNKNKKTGPGDWYTQNLPFDGANARLAKTIGVALEKARPGRQVRIVRSGRLMLEGLAMPAALIEPVDLTNPQDEIALEDNEHIDLIADNLMAAIAEYFGVKKVELAPL